MFKKILMLPLMAFALVTLTAATVTENGEDIFEWELIGENEGLPSDRTEDAFYENTAGTDNDMHYETYIYDNGDYLDVYISSDQDSAAVLFYNFDDNYQDYDISENMVDSGVNYNQSLSDYIHIEISEYDGYEISLIGGTQNSDMMNDEDPSSSTFPSITEFETFSVPRPTVFEEVGGALSTIVTAGSSVFVAAFDGLWDVFWDADANDGDGALNWIAYVAVLPVGFFLVRWAFRKVLGMIQQRL